MAVSQAALAQTTVVLESIGAEDGNVLETAENSNIGGTVSSLASSSLRVGDDNVRRQEVAILSFDTSTLPAGAVVVSATLSLRTTTLVGSPASLAPLVADVTSGSFGTSAAVESVDFESAATAPAAATFETIATGTATRSLSPAGLSAINLAGRTQVRLRLTLDDNNNTTSDRLSVGSGEITPNTLRPRLSITYAMPTPVPTETPTPTASPTPTEVPTVSPIPTESPVPTQSPTPSPSPTQSPVPTPWPGAVSATFVSIAAEDGNVKEASENAGIGGTVSSVASSSLRVGDDSSRRQELAILSFDTSTLPPGAIIVGASLQLRTTTTVGSPASLAPMVADVKSGFFGTSEAVELEDFESAPTASAAATFETIATGTALRPLNGAGVAAINPAGRTQVRVRLALDDNNNAADDRLSIGSGEITPTTQRPQLIVTYVVPTPVPTETPTPTASPSPTESPTPTVTPTASPSPTESPTATPSPTVSPVPTDSPTPTVSPSPSPSPTATPIPTPWPGAVTASFVSLGTEDGNVRETAENSSVGGTVSSVASSSLRVGDDGGRRQEVAILSFDTSTLPSDALIVGATLTLRTTALVGSPLALGPLLADVNSGDLGTLPTVETVDFEAPATAPAAASFPVGVTGNATASLAPDGVAAVNRFGRTQVRLRMTLDDNNNGSDDRVSVASGDITPSTQRPLLVVTYVLPTPVPTETATPTVSPTPETTYATPTVSPTPETTYATPTLTPWYTASPTPETTYGTPTASPTPETTYATPTVSPTPETTYGTPTLTPWYTASPTPETTYGTPTASPTPETTYATPSLTPWYTASPTPETTYGTPTASPTPETTYGTPTVSPTPETTYGTPTLTPWYTASPTPETTYGTPTASPTPETTYGTPTLTPWYTATPTPTTTPIACEPSLQVDFEDTTATLAALQWTPSGADSTKDYAYDPTTFVATFDGATVPVSPNGGGKALKMAVNLVSPAATEAVTFYLPTVSGQSQYEITFDALQRYNGPPEATGVGTTQFLTFGIGAPSAAAGFGTGWTTPFTGWMVAVSHEGGTASAYRYYEGYGGLPVSLPTTPNWLGANATTAAAWASVFPSPTYPRQGTPGRVWTRWTYRVNGSQVQILVQPEGASSATLVADFNSGMSAGSGLAPFVGLVDPFTSVAVPSEDNFLLIDNLSVCVGLSPTATPTPTETPTPTVTPAPTVTPTVTPIDCATLSSTTFETTPSLYQVTATGSDVAVDTAFDPASFFSGFDSDFQTMPSSPGGGKALRLAANTSSGLRHAVSYYALEGLNHTRYEVTFDAYHRYNGPANGTGTGTTQYLAFGFGDPNTPASFGFAPSTPFNGLLLAVAAEGGSGTSYRCYQGTGSGTSLLFADLPNWLGFNALNPSAWTSVFSSPTYPKPGSPGRVWTRWTFNVDGNRVVVFVKPEGYTDPIQVADFYAPISAGSGFAPFVGLVDNTVSVAVPPEDSFLVIDNLEVCLRDAAPPTPTPTVTPLPTETPSPTPSPSPTPGENELYVNGSATIYFAGATGETTGTLTHFDCTDVVLAQLPPSINVTPGTVLTLTATGTACTYQTTFGCSGPEGQTSGDFSFPDYDLFGVTPIYAPYGALVAKWDNDPTPFLVGIGGSFAVPAGATKLYLAVHDTVCWADNGGFYAVQFSVGGSVPTPTVTPTTTPMPSP